MSDNQDPELRGIKDADKATFVDRLRSKLHPKIDHDDAGNVIYPRKEYLEARIKQRIAESADEQKRAEAAMREKLRDK